MIKEGIVVRSLASFFYVQIEKQIIECRASKKLKGKNRKIIVGDYVIVNIDDSYIIDTLPRENELIRPLICNVQKSFLVFSAAEPKMNYGLLDRMLSLMEINGIESTIVITKCDLLALNDLSEIKVNLEYYQRIGYQVIYLEMETVPTEIIELLADDKYIITGQTGVGKSTLINKIIPDLNLQTQEISKVLGRGKHTTREVTFYQYKSSYLIDSPGFSSLELNTESEIVRDSFIDFIALADECKFNGCNHISEPKCNVKNQVEAGNILPSRYENYVKLMMVAKEEKWKKY